MNLNISPGDLTTPEIEVCLERVLEGALARLQKQLGTTKPSKLLLSAHEAAETLGICEKSLWNFTQPRGAITSVKIGSRVLYSPDDLRAWIDAQKTEGGG